MAIARERPAILFVSHESVLYGAPRSLLMLVEWFAERCRCEVVTVGDGRLVEALDKINVRTHVLPEPANYRPGVRGLLIDRPARQCRKLLNALAIRGVARRMGADLIYVNTVSRLSSIVGGLLSRSPTVVHVREVENFLAPKSPIRRRLLRAILSRVTRFIAVSKASREALLRAAPGVDARIVHNGLDTTKPPVTPEERSRARQRLGAEAQQLLVGFVGKRSQRKGYDVFAEVAAEMTSADNRLHFAAIGDAHPSITRHEEHGPVVSNLPFQVSTRPFFAAFDIFIMASRQEPFSRVNLEASEAGCAIVATNVDGNRELYTNEKTALLVPPGDPEAMANAIHRLASCDKLRRQLGDAARSMVEQGFAAERCHKQILDNISDLLPETTAPATVNLQKTDTTRKQQ